MKQNRSTLKQYFTKGAIPTESNFADLIDSMLNQQEDNIDKLPNDPLQITATGTDEALLNFYRVDQGVEKLSWQVKQNPGGNAPGLSFGDDTATHLFVQTGTGKVGIGTTTPGANLEVSNTAAGQLGSVLRVSNLGGGAGTQAALDFTTYPVGANLPGARVLVTDNNYGADIEIQTKNSGAVVNPLTTRLKITADGNLVLTGNLGFGSVPRTGLDTMSHVMSGAPNEYMKAQFTMSGGGTVTWGGPGQRLKWTARMIAISVGGPINLLHGHVNIIQPVANIPAAQVYDGNVRSATLDGVVLNAWEALYAVHTVGGDENAVSFQIVRYTNNFNAPSNWLLVAVVNYDDSTVRLGTGVILSANSSSSQGSPIPQGVIMMWSGKTNTIPGGWALCDGSNGTPNLKDRFIVGAGASYGVGDTGGLNAVGLTAAQMPSHNHNNGVYTALLYRRPDGQWTIASTDNTVGEPDIVHTADIAPAGGDQAHENRPPYYALAYIMKL